MARSSTNLLGFPAGTRIATPVCALVRNDMQILARCQRLQGRFSGSKPAVPRYYAGRRQISTCHCEERSDVAIRNPAEGHSKIAVLRANSLGVTNWPKVVPTCQAPLRGPRHWFAMTCRRQRRVCGCKAVGRNDMLKVVTRLRLQGGLARGVRKNLPRGCRARGNFHPLGAKKAPEQSKLCSGDGRG